MIKCEWLTCKYNSINPFKDKTVEGICSRNDITLKVFDLEESIKLPKDEEVSNQLLHCDNFEWDKEKGVI